MIALFALSFAAPPAAFNDAPTREQTTFFESKIRPVLIEHCYSCHSTEKGKVKGGLDLTTREGVRAGGDTGPVIVPGNPEKSPLILAVRHANKDTAMPPKGKLPAAAIEDLSAWVKAGAPDPRVGEAKPQKHEIDIEEGRKFWSFQPAKRAAPPEVADETWNANFIDRFIRAGLEAKKLKPVGDADKRTLARRLYLDLTGLPPTPAESDAFAADASPDAVAKLADNLLASSAFGERWGRHWLDVARYAESTGKSVNFNFPHAWRYRDYVIAAYNADKPFDRFVKEQLAGDLLPAGTDAEKAENLIATGFLAVGTKSLNERNRVQFELDVADEQIDAFSQAFLGLTAACARCHDHKFDPIPTKDYYALVGIFRSTETCYGTVRFVQANHPSPLISLPPEAVPAAVPPLSAKEREAVEKQLAAAQKQFEEAKDPIRKIFPFSQMNILKAKLDSYEKDGTPKARAMGAKEKFRASNSPVYTRGEPDKAGPTVPRGVLQAVGDRQPNVRSGSGRKELAEWVASRDNPLTARVYVNRVWLHLFGRGLVASPDNFGTTGTAPSNRALLDSLAVWFADNGWSTKKLIKLLVTTRAYRLSTQYDATNFTADPDNALCWRMTPGRLDAEVIRDSVLAVAGSLKTQPPVGSVIAQAGEGPTQRPQLVSAVRPDPNDPHRAVYLPIVRDNLPEVLGLFDGADASLVTGDRANTTVPSQALFLMNSQFVTRASDAAAAKVYGSGTTDAARVKYAYKLFFGRPATDAELERAESFLAKFRAASKGRNSKDAWSALCQALFGSAEFLMRN